MKKNAKNTKNRGVADWLRDIERYWVKQNRKSTAVKARRRSR